MTAEHTVVPHDEWVRAHQAFLVREKQFTRQYGSGAPGFEDREGFSIFLQNGPGQVFHTYSAYARGIDAVNGAYQFLDLVPLGRAEPAEGNPQCWVRRHDEYGC